MKKLILSLVFLSSVVLALEDDKDFAVYCTTETSWVHVVTNVAPTNCPNNATHSFRSGSFIVWDSNPHNNVIVGTTVVSESDITKYESNQTYVSLGDLGGWDVLKAGLTLDNSFNDLILTNVPNGAASVVIIVNTKIDTETMEMRFRKKGHTGTINVRRWMPEYTNQILQREFVVSVDTNSTIQYRFSTNGTWNVVKIVAVGYNTITP